MLQSITSAKICDWPKCRVTSVVPPGVPCGIIWFSQQRVFFSNVDFLNILIVSKSEIQVFCLNVWLYVVISQLSSLPNLMFLNRHCFIQQHDGIQLFHFDRNRSFHTIRVNNHQEPTFVSVVLGLFSADDRATGFHYHSRRLLSQEEPFEVMARYADRDAMRRAAD